MPPVQGDDTGHCQKYPSLFKGVAQNYQGDDAMKDALKRGFFGFFCCLIPTWLLVHDLTQAAIIDAVISIWMIICWWGLSWVNRTFWLPRRGRAN